MHRQFKSLLLCPQVSGNLKRYKYSKIKPVLDTSYLLNPDNVPEIAENIVLRKGVGDIHQVHQVLGNSECGGVNDPKLESLLLKIPNKTHPEVKNSVEPSIIKYYNERPAVDFKQHQFQDIAHKNKWFRMEHLSNFTGNKSYYLLGDLAALVSYN